MDHLTCVITSHVTDVLSLPHTHTPSPPCHQDLGLKDNVALIVLLQPKFTQQQGQQGRGGRVVGGFSEVDHPHRHLREVSDGGGPDGLLAIANTHVLFNPNRGDIKLGQLRVILGR